MPRTQKRSAADRGSVAARRGTAQAGRPLPAPSRPARAGRRTAGTGLRSGPPVDDWDAELDRMVAESVLARLTEPHRTVLVLRYMDDCSVGECARADRAHRACHRSAAGPRPAGFQTSSIRKEARHDATHCSVLHTDDLPVQPDPAFAARLRQRLESALVPTGRRSSHERHRDSHFRLTEPPPLTSPRGRQRCPT